MLPEEVRRRAQETRAVAPKLVKESGQLQDRADVLMREAEVAVAALRAAMKPSAVDALRHVIRSKLRDGNLPYDDIPATIPGRPGRPLGVWRLRSCRHESHFDDGCHQTGVAALGSA